MRLRFTKMQGAGNDFVVLDGVRQPLAVDAALARRLADRRFGIGADQVLLVEPPPGPGVDFRYRIFNADGGEVEQCGNGARCFVKFVHQQGLTDARSIRVITAGGLIEPMLEADGEVTVDMGAPRFEPQSSGFDPRGLAPAADGAWTLEVGGSSVRITVVSMGNPHAVQWVDDIDAAPLATLGPLIEHHPRFAARVNAGFAQPIDRHAIRLRVWERGAGETLACGTGACAATVAGIAQGRLGSPVAVHARGGVLRIAWDGDGASVRMTGPAETVYVGEIEIG